MRLTFRGHQSEASSAIAPDQLELTGKYRGYSTVFFNAHPGMRSNIQLTYRGVTYTR
uniref:DUF4278 domain-containing protein n=1 Tax=Oscillatoriales cyanobacterium SpSt-402 TaxID=2282168 RepID=A0A832H4F1_9CYAN